MSHIVASIVEAIILFVLTDIDDIVVLVSYFGNPRFQNWQIILGQYFGIGLLFSASAVAAPLALSVPARFVGLLGIVPILLGIKSALNVRASSDPPMPTGRSHLAEVAAVTVASGADNLSVYIPLFATHSSKDIVIFGGVFALLTGIWVSAAHWLARRSNWGSTIRRYARPLTPIALIVLGVFILFKSVAA